jgi:hypothetical protein
MFQLLKLILCCIAQRLRSQTDTTSTFSYMRTEALMGWHDNVWCVMVLPVCFAVLPLCLAILPLCVCVLQ